MGTLHICLISISSIRRKRVSEHTCTDHDDKGPAGLLALAGRRNVHFASAPCMYCFVHVRSTGTTVVTAQRY